ncbi:unnamed protein product [Schistocephalus solidus]|uniref:Uncharacterized protein n=1 Tax=Schistocephalus solidus TaxID=70667 RepID=A0A183SGC7_SCHSO|nr:unnamed protein product [Schistocephalus solidus]
MGPSTLFCSTSKTKKMRSNPYRRRFEGYQNGLGFSAATFTANYCRIQWSARPSPKSQSHCLCTEANNNNFGDGHVADASDKKAHVKRICEIANAPAGKPSAVVKVALPPIEHSRYQDTTILAPQQTRTCSISVDERMPAGAHSISRQSSNGYAQFIIRDTYDADKPTSVPVGQCLWR